MAQYNTDEEQLDALRRWWNENGRSTIAAIVIALAAGFGWQAWQKNDLRQQEQASDIYQALLRTLSAQEAPGESQSGVELAEQLKSEYGSTSYAQFAALHLAAMAVKAGKLPDAEAQLRWVLGKAATDSDTARIAQLRLARVIAASGDTQQALTILDKAEPGPYGASYAAARGDILLAANQRDAAREAYTLALEIANSNAQGINLPALQQKLHSLTPVPPRPSEAGAPAAADTAAATPGGETAVAPQE
jgi:predicted negative regulator of RcsB-dependent stress response